MRNFKILGTEPAQVVAAVEVVLAVLLSFGVFGLSQAVVGAVVAAVTAALGFVTAYATHRRLLAATTGVFKAAFVLVASLGFTLTDGQQAAVLAAVAVLGGIFIRQNTFSLPTAVSAPSPGAPEPAAVPASTPVSPVEPPAVPST